MVCFHGKVIVIVASQMFHVFIVVATNIYNKVSFNRTVVSYEITLEK